MRLLTLTRQINTSTIYATLTAIALVAVAAGWRIINHQTMLMPNLELVTATSLMAAVWLPKRWSLVVPLGTLVVSEFAIGNSSVAWFTWSAFLLLGASGWWLRRWKSEARTLLLSSTGMGLGAALFFFAWTNFGVWVLGDGSYYPHTWAGLLLCYEMGLPFIRATLISGAVFTPVLFAAGIYLPKMAKAATERMAVSKA